MSTAHRIPRPDPGEWNGSEYVFEFWTRIRNTRKNPRESGPDEREYDNRFWGRAFGRNIYPVRTQFKGKNKKQGFLLNCVHQPRGPADPRFDPNLLLFLENTIRKWGLSRTIFRATGKIIEFPLFENVTEWVSECKGVLGLWPQDARDRVVQAATEVYRHHMRLTRGCSGMGGHTGFPCDLADQSGPAISRAVTAYEEKIHRRKSRAKPQEKVYELKIDPEAFTKKWKGLIMSTINTMIWTWRLDEIQREDIEQIVGDVNLAFCARALAGGIQARYGINGIKSYMACLKTIARRKAIKFCGKMALEQEHRGELPEWASIEDLSGDGFTEFDGEGDEFTENWIDVWLDMQLFEVGKKGNVIQPDSHKYGQRLAREYEERERYWKALEPLGKNGAIHWLYVWVNGLARGDDRVDAYDFGSFQRIFKLTPRQVKRVIHLARVEFTKQEFIDRFAEEKFDLFRYDRGWTIYRPSRLSNGECKFLLGYRAPDEIVSADTIPSEWGSPSPRGKHFVRPPHRAPEFKGTPSWIFGSYSEFTETWVNTYKGLPERFDPGKIMPPINQPIFPADEDLGQYDRYWLDYKQIPHPKAKNELFWPF